MSVAIAEPAAGKNDTTRAATADTPRIVTVDRMSRAACMNLNARKVPTSHAAKKERNVA